MMRIGSGMDVHALVLGRDLVLCGVKVPHEKGLLGHSDADVATHALIDALLGASALGDIGKLFPDTDRRYAGISSLALLDEVVRQISALGLKPVNVDITIAAQRPRLRPYIDRMRGVLAEHLGVSADVVSVKATTTERLGFEGEEKGMSAYAVCLLESVK
ncbi:MAG: 2-C-methyl-D-erythritol 2,4-cyclodiphosphate synthase [Bacillota bacterium]